MNKDQAVDAARNILNGPRAYEGPRLQRIAQALRPNTPNGVVVPHKAPDSMKRAAAQSATNFLPLVVKTFSQVMKVDNYFASGGTEAASPWEHWQRNQMDARQTGIHTDALKYGASYVVLAPGDRGPVMKGVSPRNMTAVYADPTTDEWPMLALQVDRQLMYLYDERYVYTLGAENMPTGTFGTWQWGPATQLKFIDQREHGFGVCPVVRFRDRMLLEGEEQFGIVEPLITIQERINETTYEMLVAQYFGAFKQRYVMGWMPESERDALSATAGDVWFFKNPETKVGQYAETDPNYYIQSKASALRDLSAIGQIPAQNLGVDGISNISAETLAALEAGKDRESSEIETSLGESWEQALRGCAHLAGDAAAAEDYGSEVKWRDSTARSFAQAVDGLGKIATMLNVPDELLWEDIPGWTKEKVDRAKAVKLETDPLAGLDLPGPPAPPQPTLIVPPA